MSSQPPPGSGTTPSLSTPEPTHPPSKSYKPHFLADPPAAPTRATFETIQGIITPPPPAASGPSFHRKTRSTDAQATAEDTSSGAFRSGAAAMQETPSPGDATGISPFNSFFAAAPCSSTANTNTNTVDSTNKNINKASTGMSPEALHAAVIEYTKAEVEKGEKAQDKRMRSSMKKYMNQGGDGAIPEELSESERVICGPAMGSALDKYKQSEKGKGKGKSKSEKLVERFKEYTTENAAETSLPPPTPRLKHASLPPTTTTTTAESSHRPRYSSSFEGRRRSSATFKKREPLPVVTSPRPGESSHVPRRPSEAHPRPQTQVPAEKEQEKYGSPFDTWLSDLEKRVEKRVAKMEGREQETLVEKRRLCDRRSYLIAPILVVPRQTTSSSVLLGLRHIDFSRPSWQFGTAGEDRIRALLDAEEDNLEVVVEGDDLGGEGNEEMEGSIRRLLGLEHEEAKDAEVEGVVRVPGGETGEEQIEDLDLGISVADDEGDDDLATNLDNIKRSLGMKEFLDEEDEEDEEIAGAASASGDRKGKGRAL